jgi:hypothetical protein
METVDDPVALQQVLAYFQVPPDRLGGIGFDIWVNEPSGATIALPEGADPMPAEGFCTARNEVGLEVMITGNQVEGSAETQVRSVEFETAVAAAFPEFFWRIDPAWTYPFPHVNGKDGMAVNRKSYVGISRYHGQPAAYATSALVSRGQAFIGIVVLDPDVDYRLSTACQFNPMQPGCQELHAQAMNWAPFALGTLLTTFPPS